MWSKCVSSWYWHVNKCKTSGLCLCTFKAWSGVVFESASSSCSTQRLSCESSSNIPSMFRTSQANQTYKHTDNLLSVKSENSHLLSRILAGTGGAWGPSPQHSRIGPLWMRVLHFQQSSQPGRRADLDLRGNPRHSERCTRKEEKTSASFSGSGRRNRSLDWVKRPYAVGRGVSAHTPPHGVWMQHSRSDPWGTRQFCPCTTGFAVSGSPPKTPTLRLLPHDSAVNSPPHDSERRTNTHFLWP